MPHFQPVSCSYVLLPTSEMEGTVQDLEVLILLVSYLTQITPYPKSGGPQPQHCSPTVLVAPSELLSSLPSSCWEQHGLQGQESRRSRVFSFPTASTNEAVLIGQEGRRCCRGAGIGLTSLILEEQWQSTALCRLVSHLHRLFKFWHDSSYKLCY